MAIALEKRWQGGWLSHKSAETEGAPPHLAILDSPSQELGCVFAACVCGMVILGSWKAGVD